MHFAQKFAIAVFSFITGISVYAQEFEVPPSIPASIDTAITADRLRELVSILASDSMDGRLTGSQGAAAAAAFIHHWFEENDIGYMQMFGGYYHLFNTYVNNEYTKTFNVIGYIPGAIQPDSILMFSAHFDHLGGSKNGAGNSRSRSAGRKAGKDKIFNGANDNASGVSAMLALARYLRHNTQPYYSIMFVAFSGEEQGLLGSQAALDVFPLDKIFRIINLEMLGRPEKKAPFITFDAGMLGLIDKLNNNLHERDKSYDRKYFGYDPYNNQALFTRSDNFPFAEKGIEANTIMATSPYDKYYHHVNDEWETLDYDAMAKIVKAIAIAVTPIVMGKP